MPEYGLERKFKRRFRYANQLEDCLVFADLRKRVEKGDFFAAIREDRLDFYYKGQRAARRGMRSYQTSFLKEKGSFSFVGEFDENGKNNLAAVIQKCGEHANDKGEGLQLSKVFPHFSWARHSKGSNSPILIDVEARFASLEKNGNFDKIDLVFIIPEQKALLFVEGKRQRDPRVRSSTKGIHPEVLDQIERYENQLVAREKDGNQIVKAYAEAIEHLNEIFNVELPVPESVLPKVPILIVGEFKPEDDIKERAKTVDLWLEKELVNIAKSEGITGKIEWSKLKGNKAILIDGREIFRNPDTQMGLLGDTLNHLAIEISSNA